LEDFEFLYQACNLVYRPKLLNLIRVQLQPLFLKIKQKTLENFE
jgi:hypothetical protein